MTKLYAINCDACGAECLNNETHTVKLSCFDRSMRICGKCMTASAEQSFKDAAEIMSEIVSLAKRDDDAEDRLELIRRLLNE